MSTPVASVGVLGLQQRQAALRAGSIGCLIVSGGVIIDGVVTGITIFAFGFLGLMSGMSTVDDAIIGLVVSHGILVRVFVHRPRAVIGAGFGISSIPTILFALIFFAGYLVTSAGQSAAGIVSISFPAVFGFILAVTTPLIAGYAFPWISHAFR